MSDVREVRLQPRTLLSQRWLSVAAHKAGCVGTWRKRTSAAISHP